MRKVKIVRINKNDTPRKNRHQKKKRGFFSFLGRLIFCLVAVIMLAVAAGGCFLSKQLSSIPRTVVNSANLSISASALEANVTQNIQTIAIFGVDGDENSETLRSDTILLLTVNIQNGQMCLTSVMRDTYVNIPGYGYGKINAAYAFNGAEGALSALNSNFDLNLTDFVSVNFASLPAIVNALGGLTLTVSEEEAAVMNEDILGSGEDYAYLTSKPVSVGTQLMDGAQVLSYSRIRYLGNSDFDRTARQRIVFKALLEKIASLRNPFTAAALVKAACSHMNTSLTNKKIYSLMYTVISHRTLTGLSTGSLNNSDNLKSAVIDSQSVLVPYYLTDLASDLHSLLYPLQAFSPSEELWQASDELAWEVRNVKLTTIYTGTTF